MPPVARDQMRAGSVGASQRSGRSEAPVSRRKVSSAAPAAAASLAQVNPAQPSGSSLLELNW